MLKLFSQYARIRTSLCAALLLAFAGGAGAWTQKPVRIVVPAVAGGTADIIARVLADQLSKDVGTTFIVDNKRGAGASIAVSSLLSSPPDGQTIMVAMDNLFTETPHVVKQSFTPYKDILPIAAFARSGFVLVSNTELPAKEFKGLIAYLKANPQIDTFASYAIGSTSHYAGLLFGKKADLKLQHVPFVGSPPALIQVMSGQIPIMFDGIVTSLPLIRGGKLKPYAIGGVTSRSPALPDVPTLAELGYGEIDFENLAVVIAPSAVPAEVAEKIRTAVFKAASAAAVHKRLAEMGLEAVQPQSIAALVNAEKDSHARIGKIIKDFNLDLKQ